MRASYRHQRATSSAKALRPWGSRSTTLLMLLFLGGMGEFATAQFPGEGPAPEPEAANQEETQGAPSGEYSNELSPDEAALPSSRPMQLPDPIGMERLSKVDRAWIDAKRNRVLVDGQVSLREGVLEMFACPRNTKEHESVVSVEAKAFVLHAGLLAAGAEPGGPVRFDPEYQPPFGTEINIDVLWLDNDGKRHKVRAQEWVRDVRTKKAMKYPWVFAGSGFWRDEETGRQHYMAEAGDLICVSNFTTAMLDVPAESTNVNTGLAFEAFTEKIPPLGTPVRLVLTPVLKQEKGDKGAEKKSTEEKPAGENPAEKPAER